MRLLGCNRHPLYFGERSPENAILPLHRNILPALAEFGLVFRVIDDDYLMIGVVFALRKLHESGPAALLGPTPRHRTARAARVFAPAEREREERRQLELDYGRSWLRRGLRVVRYSHK